MVQWRRDKTLELHRSIGRAIGERLHEVFDNTLHDDLPPTLREAVRRLDEWQGQGSCPG